MAINHAKLFNRRVTPQSQPIPGSAQVRNSAGGYSWAVDDWTRFDRFLILGAEGGTYYIGERELVKQNHDALPAGIKVNWAWSAIGDAYNRQIPQTVANPLLRVCPPKRERSGRTFAAALLPGFFILSFHLPTQHRGISANTPQPRYSRV